MRGKIADGSWVTPFSEKEINSVNFNEYTEANAWQYNFFVLVHSGLEMHQKTPNVEGLREYLRHRWRYWDLDVKHPNIFAGV